MTTFYGIVISGVMDVKNIIAGLSLELKAAALSLLVAIMLVLLAIVLSTATFISRTNQNQYNRI